MRLLPSSRRSKAKHFKWPLLGSRLLPKAALRLRRRCSAASVLPFSKGMTATAGAAALAIAADKAADATGAGGVPTGWTRRTRPPARARFAAVQICFACGFEARASRSLTNRLPRISSPSFCRASRSPNSRIAFRPRPLRLQLDHPSFGAEASAAPPAARTFTDEELSAGLPGSLFATPSATVPEEHETQAADLNAAETSTSAPEYADASPDAKREIARDLDELDPASGSGGDHGRACAEQLGPFRGRCKLACRAARRGQARRSAGRCRRARRSDRSGGRIICRARRTGRVAGSAGHRSGN